MTPVPTVSIITSAYNGVGLIEETIASVQAQTFTDFEWIIVDDCSSDGTVALVREVGDPRIRVLPGKENVGPVRARNRAVSFARGRYIAGLDQDDICRPERLARQVAHLEANPATVLIATAAEFLENGRLRPSAAPPRSTPALIRFVLGIMNPLIWSSIMVRREAAHRLEPFTRPEIVYAEDFDLYHRLLSFGEIARIDEPLMIYRAHAGGVSQIHADRMVAAATRIVADAHRALFGAAAETNAELLVRYCAAKLPAPDLPTLARVAVVLDRVVEDFLAREAPDPESRALIGDEASRLWWSLVRTSIHAGCISRRDALSVRPATPLVTRDVPRSALLKAEIVGRARALRQRLREDA
jgi:glycosyltransferase involved in cell wall biosynthesis